MSMGKPRSSLSRKRTVIGPVAVEGETSLISTLMPVLGKTLPLVTRAAPEKLPEGVTVGFARPVIVHVAGDVAPEMIGTQHWWKNNTNKPVTLISADILHDEGDAHTM